MPKRRIKHEKDGKRTTSSSKVRKRGSKRKSKKIISKVLPLITIFVISAVFLSLIAVKKTINISYVSASSGSGVALKDKDLMTFVIVSTEEGPDQPILINKLLFVIADKANKKIFTYDINTQTSVDIVGKYGNEKLEKVFALGSMNDSSFTSGVNLLQNTLEHEMGVKVDRYLTVNGTRYTTMHDFLTGVLSVPGYSVNTLYDILTTIKTDMTIDELYAVYGFINSIPQDRFINKSLSDNLNIDNDLRDLAFDSKIALENKKMVVLNGTGLPGVAGYGSRILENAGGYVIEVANGEKVYDKSRIITDSLDSETTKYIADFFDITDIQHKDLYSGEESAFVRRGDVVLILGLDIVDRL